MLKRLAVLLQLVAAVVAVAAGTTASSIFAGVASSLSPAKRHSSTAASCDVFDPFKVSPESTKYQLGGAFPLHAADCVRVNAATVQEIVGIQWALSYWNQRPTASTVPAAPRIGFFAGDSCRRPRESVSQTLRFLDAVGFHEPRECASAAAAQTQQRLLGVLAPKDYESARALGSVMRPSRAPLGAYSTAAAEALLNADARNVLATAPTLSNYVDTLAALLAQLDNSNLVALVDAGEDASPDALAHTRKVADALRRRGIFVNEVIGYAHPLLTRILAESDSQIVVSLVGPEKFKQHVPLNVGETLLKMRKIWITLDLDAIIAAESGGDELAGGALVSAPFNPDTYPSLSMSDINLESIVIRPVTRRLTDFNAYFLRVLSNNYESFSLLSAYIQQVYNCSLGDASSTETTACTQFFENDARLLRSRHRQSGHVESALKLVYAFALIGERLQGTPALKDMCDDPSTPEQCYDAIVDAALDLDYRFGAFDPADLRTSAAKSETGTDVESTLRFYEQVESGSSVDSARSLLMLNDIAIEALWLERAGRDGMAVYRLLETRTAAERPALRAAAVPTRLRSIRSTCPAYRPYCGTRCEHAKRFEIDEIFLSNPATTYALYLAGIFDFHGGPNCEILRGSENVALPLAFSYAVASYRDTAPSNQSGSLEFGAILVDGCSSDRKIMEFLVESENGCYRFPQSDRNWTIVAGSTFGYIATSPPSVSATGTEVWPSVVERFFTTQNSPAPVLTIDNTRRPAAASAAGSAVIMPDPASISPLGSIFSAMPSHRDLAIVVAKYLRRQRWDFINVVVDETDGDSVAVYNEFKRYISTSANAANALCVAEIVAFNGNAGAIPRIADDAANVTLLFTGARAAADYLSARLRQSAFGGADGGSGMSGGDAEAAGSTVHVVIGDAHDFHLHDPANMAHYTGTVSIQPKDVLDADFRRWLTTVTPLSLPETWFWRYVEERWQCALSQRNRHLYQGRLCTGDELLNVPQMGRMTKAGYLLRSTRILLGVADAVHRRLCGDAEETADGTRRICDAFAEKGRLQIRNELARMAADDAFEVAEFQPIDHHGNFGYVLIENYTTRAGFHTVEPYKPFLNGVQLPNAVLLSRCTPPLCKCATGASMPKPSVSLLLPLFDDAPPLVAHKRADATSGSYVHRKPAASVADFPLYDAEIEALPVDEWQATPLKYVFLALTSLFCVLAVATLALVAVKTYFRIVKGNQSLGVILLLGILLLYMTAFAYVVNPSDTACRYRVTLHALAHALCFSVLIVKAMQLRNAESLGVVYGHQISYWNYWLLLIFIFVVQLVICLRWLANPSAAPSLIYFASGSGADSSRPPAAVLRCTNSTAEFFLAEAYSFTLLIVALFLAAFNRNIKRNYREAKWLFAASLSATVVMTLWVVAQAFVSPLYMDYVTIVELYLCGSALLVFVFGPKLYVLLSYEPVIVDCSKLGSGASGRSFANGGGGTGDEMFEKSYDLFEADSTLPSRTTSPVLSAGRFPAGSPTSSSGSGATYGGEPRAPSSGHVTGEHRGPADPIFAGRSRSRSPMALSASALSTRHCGPNTNEPSSDCEGLSSLLHTVLRKKVPVSTAMRRSQSETDHNVKLTATVSTSADASVQPLPQHKYSSFVVLPRLTETLGVNAASSSSASRLPVSATAAARRPRSVSQKR